MFAGWERVYLVNPTSGAVIEEVPVRSKEIDASLTSVDPNQVFLAGGTVSGPSIMFSLSPGRQVEILWQSKEVENVVASPIAIENRVFVIDGDGVLMALNSTNGKQIDRLDLPAQVFSSPIAIGDMLYVFDSSGVGCAMRHTPSLAVVATTKIEPVYATPAVASPFLLVRTEAAIYCFRL
jgi:PQQ-like domain